MADLTDANPNVYWELGVRQSFKHGTITIAEIGTPLPFDLGGKGTLFYYPGDHIKMREFEKEFHEAINDCLNNPDLPDSHVIETISGRGSLYQIITRDESIRKLDALISEIERNKYVLEDILNVHEENVKKRKEALAKGKRESQASTGVVTARFCLVAVEMLVTSKYIDADQTFYKTAERYMDWLISINDQLPAWANEPESTESWLLKVKEHTKSSIKKFMELAIEHKKALEATL